MIEDILEDDVWIVNNIECVRYILYWSDSAPRATSFANQPNSSFPHWKKYSPPLQSLQLFTPFIFVHSYRFETRWINVYILLIHKTNSERIWHWSAILKKKIKGNFIHKQRTLMINSQIIILNKNDQRVWIMDYLW